VHRRRQPSSTNVVPFQSPGNHRRARNHLQVRPTRPEVHSSEISLSSSGKTTEDGQSGLACQACFATSRPSSVT
jgi:hypothetical protein